MIYLLLRRLFGFMQGADASVTSRLDDNLSRGTTASYSQVQTLAADYVIGGRFCFSICGIFRAHKVLPKRVNIQKHSVRI